MTLDIRSVAGVAYRGPVVGCGWCCYEIRGTGVIPDVARATHVIATERGDRQVCAMHAERGGWRHRMHRGGALA